MNTAQRYINPYLDLSLEQQATINHLHSVLNGTGISAESVFAVMFIPIGYVVREGILPGAYTVWFAFGLGMYDWLYHLFTYESKLIRNWRWFNLLYFIQRYFGTGMIITSTFWSVIGQNGNCKSYYYFIYGFCLVSFAATQGIFLTRVAVLTNWNKYIVGVLGTLILASSACVIWVYTENAIQNPPEYLPVIFCESYIKTKTPFIASAFITLPFDILVFIITVWALRDVFKHGIFTKGNVLSSPVNRLRFVILRDNLLYIIMVASADIVTTTLIFYHPENQYYMMVVPFGGCLHIIFGCRVFIQLKFNAAQFNGTCITETSASPVPVKTVYNFGFTEENEDGRNEIDYDGDGEHSPDVNKSKSFELATYYDKSKEKNED